MGLFIFFSLNPYFLANFKLITNPVALLSNNVSTVIPSCISILSSPIFAVTSLSMSPLSRLQQDILSIALASITNLLLLESNQRLLDPLSLLNYFVYCSHCHHTPVFSPSQFCFLLPCSYNFLLNVQIFHNYNSYDSLSYPHPWHIGCIEQTLLSIMEGVPLPYLSFPLLLSELVLLKPAAEVSPVS